MIVIVHKDHPNRVFATHTDAQEIDVLAAYAAEDYGVLRVVDPLKPFTDLPEDFEVIRALPAA